MFQKLTDFSMQRQPLQAVGFYIFAVLVMVVVMFVIGAMAGLVIQSDQTDQEMLAISMKIGNVLSIIFCMAVAFLVCWKKNIYQDTLPIALIFGSALLTWALGGFLGMIPVAYLTTRPNKNNNIGQ